MGFGCHKLTPGRVIARALACRVRCVGARSVNSVSLSGRCSPHAEVRVHHQSKLRFGGWDAAVFNEFRCRLVLIAGREEAPSHLVGRRSGRYVCIHIYVRAGGGGDGFSVEVRTVALTEKTRPVEYRRKDT